MLENCRNTIFLTLLSWNWVRESANKCWGRPKNEKGISLLRIGICTPSAPTTCCCLGRVPGTRGEVKVELKMPASLFDCYESSYIARVDFEINRRVQNQGTVTGLIEGMNYLTDEVRKAKVCCEGTTNLKSECVTCSWTEEAVNAFLDLEGFDQEVSIETDGDVLPADDCVCETEPADEYQEACVGSNCVARQVGIAEFEVYLNSYPVDTLYHDLQRIAGYFDSLGVPFYASITDYRMFCAEGTSSAFKSQSGNKDLLHFQSAFDAAEVAFWFHLAEVDGAERLLIRQKGFEGDVLDCCCELIPGDCRSNPVPVCENLVEIVDHYEAVCLGKRRDFRFLVEGNYYKHKKDVFVCPKNYPVDVTIVDAKTQLPVDSTFSWKLNGEIIPAEGHTIAIDANDLEPDKAKLKCEFTLKNGPKIKDISLKLEVRDDIEVEIKKSVSTLYAFDENKIDTFREYVNYGEKAETPWLFIESGKMDEVLAEVNKNNHYYAVNAMESPEPQLTVTPSVMASKKQEMELNHSGGGHDIYEIFACDGADPELLVYSGDIEKYTLKFYYMCETNDDIQIVPQGNIVQNSSDICIDPGPDGLLDNIQKYQTSTSDSLARIGDKYYVLAGKNKICNNSIEANDTICPNSYDTQALIDECNDVYEQIGVQFDISVESQNIYFNYDYFDNNGECQHPSERAMVQNMLVDSMPLNENESIVTVVNSLGSSGGNDISGYALDFGSKMVLLAEESGFTVAHELGHASFSLEHPGGPYKYDGNGNIIYEGQFGVDDWFNFMHGISEIIGQNKVRVNNVRRYQFNLVRNDN